MNMTIPEFWNLTFRDYYLTLFLIEERTSSDVWDKIKLVEIYQMLNATHKSGKAIYKPVEVAQILLRGYKNESVDAYESAVKKLEETKENKT